MKTPSLANLRGSVHIVLLGGDLEAMINQIAVRGLQVWEIQSIGESSASLNIFTSRFLQAAPALAADRLPCSCKEAHRLSFFF